MEMGPQTGAGIDTDEIEALRAKVGDSSFWMDEFSIPQYDYLVAQGVVTQEEADNFRKLREECGLPMTFVELKERPWPVLPEYEWLLDVGGPRITSYSEQLVIDSVEWRADSETQAEIRGKGGLEAIKHGEDYFHLLKIRFPYGENPPHPVDWESVFLVTEGVYARVRGGADSFEEARKAVKAVEVAPKSLNGHNLYRHERGYLLALSADDYVEVMPPYENSDNPVWRWERHLPENSPYEQLRKSMGAIGNLSGVAANCDEAIQSALDILDVVKGYAFKLMDGDAATAYASGHAAGKAEAKAELSSKILGFLQTLET